MTESVIFLIKASSQLQLARCHGLSLIEKVLLRWYTDWEKATEFADIYLNERYLCWNWKNENTEGAGGALEE